VYDFLIVGAGVAGCVLALKLQNLNQKVLLLDKKGVLEGGSGAAGAFLSPKLGKNYPLDNLINHSLKLSIDYFLTNYPECIVKKGVLMLPKKSKGGEEKLDEYLPFVKTNYKKIDSGTLLKEKIEGLFFEDGAIIDVKRFKNKVLENIEFMKGEYGKDELHIESKNVVFCTGCETNPPYLNITPVYGYRFELAAKKEIPFNINGEFSVSATRGEGSFALGATHYRSKEEFMVSNGSSLLKKAREMLDFDFEVIESLSGARATSVDHFPVLGGVVDIERAKKLDNRYLHSKRWDDSKLEFEKGGFVLNGLGARGFVYAPYCVDVLIEYMLCAKPIPRELDATRLLFRHFRKGLV